MRFEAFALSSTRWIRRFSNSRIRLAVRTLVDFSSGFPPWTVLTIKRSDRALHWIVLGRWTALRVYRSSNAPTVALSFRSFSGSAPRPASVQNDSMICAAIRFAAAISFVPVLRKMFRLAPSMEGALKRTCQSFRPTGGGCK